MQEPTVRSPAGEQLVAWLAEQNLSQDAFAADLGVARAVLWRWIAGRTTPTVTHAARIEERTSGAIPARAWARQEDDPAPTGTAA